MGRAKGGTPEPKITKKKTGRPQKVRAIGSGAKPLKPITNEQKIPRTSHLEGPGKLVELSDKHIRFAKRYVLNGDNGAKAARESGFSVWYATHNLLLDPLVLDEIAKYRASRAKKFEVNTERIMAELVKVAFGTLGDFLTLNEDGTPIIDCTEVGASEMAALAEVTQDTYVEKDTATSSSEEDDEEPIFRTVKKTKLKMHNKLQALEQLARIFKMYEDPSTDKDGTPERMAAKINEALRKMREADGA